VTLSLSLGSDEDEVFGLLQILHSMVSHYWCLDTLSVFIARPHLIINVTRDIDMSIPSVCLSVRLSVLDTLVLCQNG